MYEPLTLERIGKLKDQISDARTQGRGGITIGVATLEYLLSVYLEQGISP